MNSLIAVLLAVLRGYSSHWFSSPHLRLLPNKATELASKFNNPFFLKNDLHNGIHISCAGGTDLGLNLSVLTYGVQLDQRVLLLYFLGYCQESPNILTTYSFPNWRKRWLFLNSKPLFPMLLAVKEWIQLSVTLLL